MRSESEVHLKPPFKDDLWKKSLAPSHILIKMTHKAITSWSMAYNYCCYSSRPLIHCNVSYTKGHHV